MKWVEHNTLPKRICFCDGDDNASDSGEEDVFEDHEELIRERFGLLLQRNTIKKLAFQMKQKQQYLDRISSRISSGRIKRRAAVSRQQGGGMLMGMHLRHN